MNDITAVEFFASYPEFQPVGTGKFDLAKRVAAGMSSDWAGLDESCKGVATELLIAHILTIMVDGNTPIQKYETKESAVTYANGWLNSRSRPADYSFQRTDYGVLLEDLLTIQYFGVM